MSHPIISSYMNQGGPKVVYHARASEKYGLYVKCMACWSLNWLVPCDDMVSRTYLTVYENKIEYSWPFPACCCCTCDQTTTIHLDRPVASKASKAECCSPCMTHCSFCPTCCDMCGEGVVIYGAGICTTRKAGFDNAEEIARNINEARQACLARINGAHGAPSHNQVYPDKQGMER
ncbi:hypothetical protein HYH02_011786 [Chlamydomonas schloesseri]|uniref:Uncharacterized protein n=1 Tax=Chlamydomonas schloesseri TaxID=2026947 RepID=A0A835W4G0_9CHLO|nr:hypothetical protein HYH02_011786 [Chlamydomonas schloesseri]|eukprot:KAG2435491.1 hypothetical protein HYH02_011786 [Chlamydomonas schloesseri]